MNSVHHYYSHCWDISSELKRKKGHWHWQTVRRFDRDALSQRYLALVTISQVTEFSFSKCRDWMQHYVLCVFVLYSFDFINWQEDTHQSSLGQWHINLKVGCAHRIIWITPPKTCLKRMNLINRLNTYRILILCVIWGQL